MKSALKFAASLLVCLFVLWALAFFLMGGPWSWTQASRFSKAVKSADHAAIARAAVTAIRQNGTNEYLSLSGDRLTNLPTVISGLKPNRVTVKPDRMQIEFHGGFDHFGFEICDRGDVWEMSRYTEQGNHPILTITKDGLKGEQDGAANGSQPIRSETNRTSSPADSRR